MRTSGGVAALVFAALLALPAGAVERDPKLLTAPESEDAVGGGALFYAAAPDLRRIVFRSVQRLTRSDDDEYGLDIWISDRGKLTLVSFGPRKERGENSFDAEPVATSADMRAVAWTTDEDLTADDEDPDSAAVTGVDLYVRYGGRTRLVSTGPRAGVGDYNQREARDLHAYFLNASKDLRRIFFFTKEQLVAGDRDEDNDIYLRADGRTRLVTTRSPSVRAVSADGHRAILGTTDALTQSDRDERFDLFLWHDGALRKLTPGNGPHDIRALHDPGMVASSPDARRVWFYTRERLAGADRDTRQDLYESHDGDVRLVSTGPRGGNGPFDYGRPDESTARAVGGFYTATPDGRRVHFGSFERLTPDDRDTAADVYLREGGRTTLVSVGGRNSEKALDVYRSGGSRDLERTVVTTREPLTGDDHDKSYDVFEIAGGGVRRVSTGPAGGNRNMPYIFEGNPSLRGTDAFVNAVSSDGRRIFFRTGERLTGDDRNGHTNLYERFRGKTTLPKVRDHDGRRIAIQYWQVFALSPGGGELLLSTPDRLTRDDTNEDGDLYVATLTR